MYMYSAEREAHKAAPGKEAEGAPSKSALVNHRIYIYIYICIYIYIHVHV